MKGTTGMRRALAAAIALGMSAAFVAVPGCRTAAHSTAPSLSGAEARPLPVPTSPVSASTDLLVRLKQVGIVYSRHDSRCISWRVEDGEAPDDVLLTRAWSDHGRRGTITRKLGLAGDQVYVYGPARTVEPSAASHGWETVATGSYCVEIVPLRALTADHARFGDHVLYFSRDACLRAGPPKARGCGSRSGDPDGR